MDIGQDIPGALREGFQHVLDGMGLYLFPAHGRIRAADTGEEQPQVIVDFRGGGHSAPGVADIHLLFDGDGRRNTVYGLYVRLGHPAQELPRIGGQAFRKAALSLRKERVKS